MSKVKSGAAIRNLQDVQNLITGIIFRQQQEFRIENILDLVEYYMQGSALNIQNQQLYKMIDDNLDVLYIRNKVRCRDGYYKLQPLSQDINRNNWLFACCV